MGNKKGIDIFQGHHQRFVIRCFDFFDAAEKLRVGVLGSLGGVALQIPFGHRRVESFSVVEGDVLAQTKRVNLAVRRHGPGRRQTGHKCSVAVDLDKAFVDIGKYDAVNCCRRIGGGIESRWLGGLADHKFTTFYGRSHFFAQHIDSLAEFIDLFGQHINLLGDLIQSPGVS